MVSAAVACAFNFSLGFFFVCCFCCFVLLPLVYAANLIWYAPHDHGFSLSLCVCSIEISFCIFFLLHFRPMLCMCVCVNLCDGGERARSFFCLLSLFQWLFIFHWCTQIDHIYNLVYVHVVCKSSLMFFSIRQMKNKKWVEKNALSGNTVKPPPSPPNCKVKE